MTRNLYHGTTGDTILEILRSRQMTPNSDGKIFFSEFRYESVLMHGGDLKRKLTLAIQVRVEIPENATSQRAPTQGVADTLILLTNGPITADVLELYVRRPGASKVEVIRGAAEIQHLLNA